MASTLIVEDGTGTNPAADAYISLDFANSYHQKFGNAAWSSDDTVALDAAIRKSTQYIDAQFRFRGSKLTTTQALQWPRDAQTMACWGLTWPVARLQQACAELAVRALVDSLYTDQPDAAVKSESVGPISVTYADAMNGGQVRYAIVDDLLSDYTGSSRNSIRIERA
jgi:hypothetical protein